MGKRYREIRRVLADGRTVTYRYDRATGQRLSEAATAQLQAQEVEAAAQRQRQVLSDTAADGSHIPVVERLAPLAEGAGALLADVVRAYQHSPEWKLLAPSTQGNYTRALAHPLVQPWMRVACGEIKPKHIKRLRDQIANSGLQKKRARLSTGMANQVLSTLRVVIRWGMVACDLPHDCTAQIPFFATQEGHLPWSDEDFAAFFAAAPEPYLRAIQLGLWTAQRAGDLVELRWDQWDGRAITLTPRKTKRKTRKALVIPLSAEANATLAGWKRDSTTLTILATASGKPWKDGAHLGSCLWEIRRTHALPARTMHGLRVTACSRLIEAGVTTRDVMALSGHEDERSFRLYIRKADQGVRAERAASVWASITPLRRLNRE